MSRTLQVVLLLLLATGIIVSGASNATDGPHSCSGWDYPYPFGIVDSNGNGDFRDEGFSVTCEPGDNDEVGTVGDSITSYSIGNISVETAEVRAWLPVAWQCYNDSSYVSESEHAHLRMYNNDSLFRISHAKNDLFVLGCNTLGFLGSKPAADDDNETYYRQYTGCLCYCDNSQSAVSGACSGVGCCHADIPPDLVDNDLFFDDTYNHSYVVDFSPCDYAFVAEKGYYNFNVADLNMHLRQGRKRQFMPVVLDWAIGRDDNLTCKEAKKKEGYACKSTASLCLNSTNGPGYICKCRKGYEGNPYIANGCTGAIGGLFILVIMVFLWLLIKEKRKTREHFVKNGGPTLAKLNNIRLFTKEDLKKIRRTNNVIGSGGFGKVYKGRIQDIDQLVAVKEPIKGNSTDKEYFVNEISIQSRVIHKNIVKLVGCCLEVDVPILVYEFVPNGSLYDILHGSRRMPLNMGLRLQIAAESAEGLAYMHSKTNTNILHGDVKPANILLDNEFIPKISDFGISRLIATDKQHTGNVIGDMRYVDPVFVQTGLLTNKSDVYSFGVVLLELITRKKAWQSDNNSLLKNFLEAYKNDKSIIELLDKELAEVDREIIDNLSRMIMQCINLDVNQRPEMIDVEEFLRDMVKRYHSK